jgi:hypothetical protein
MARAAAKSRPDLSDEIMIAVRRVLGEVGGEDGEPRTEVVSAAPAGKGGRSSSKRGRASKTRSSRKGRRPKISYNRCALR